MHRDARRVASVLCYCYAKFTLRRFLELKPFYFSLQPSLRSCSVNDAANRLNPAVREFFFNCVLIVVVVGELGRGLVATD